MNEEEWEKHYAAFQKRMAEIDAIYKWKLHVIARAQAIAKFFLVGYIVLIFAGIIFTNYAVMGVGFLCALAVIASMLWSAYLLRSNPYPPPGGKDG